MNKKFLIVGVVVLLVLVAGAGTYLFLSKKTAEVPADTNTPKAEEKTETIAVKVATHSTLGSYLTDENGRALYVFTKDSANTSACNEQCLLKWPVFAPEKNTMDPSLSAGDFGVITRADGRSQATFKTYPLYYYVSDNNPGDVNGQGVGGVWYLVDPAKDPASLVALGQNEGSAAPAEQKAYTLLEVSLHGTPASCWLAIGGKVYDVTPIITDRKHPGGAPIVEGCGKEATALFETRPMGSGTPHSEAARTWLASFYIGDLK